MRNNGNVQQVFVTAEVARMLNYEPAHIIRVAKELAEQGILSKQEFRNAGPRTYLFNQEAIKKLRLKFDCPTPFLVYGKDEGPYRIEKLKYSDLRIVDEDLIILHDETEKKHYQAIKSGWMEGDELAEPAYEEFIDEKDYSKEICQKSDPYGWMSYIKLIKAIQKETAYYVHDLELTPVPATDLDQLAVDSPKGIIESVMTEIEHGFFQSPTGEIYRYTGSGTEVEEIDLGSDWMKYWVMTHEEAIKQLARDFNLKLVIDDLQIWKNQPFFKTEDGRRIALKEVVIEDQSAHLRNRNLSDIFNELD